MNYINKIITNTQYLNTKMITSQQRFCTYTCKLRRKPFGSATVLYASFSAPAQRRCSACCQRPPKAAAALFSLLPVTAQRCSARVRWRFGEDLRHLQEFCVDRRQRWTTNYLACLDPAAPLGLLARLHPATLLSLLSLRHQPAQTTIFR